MDKKCTECGAVYPATLEFFNKEKRGKFGLSAKCKECLNKYQKQYREENPEYYKQYRQENKEQIAEHQKQYYQDNKEHRLEYSKQWQKDNKEQVAERKKQYREDNKERIAEYAKQYKQDNKEQILEYNKQWQKDNKELVNAKNAKRRAIKRGVTVENFTAQDVLDMWGTVCHICFDPIDLNDWHMDHVYPLSKGGEHSLNNVKPSHPKCNMVKGASII